MSSGQLRWKAKLGDTIVASPTVSRDGSVVYVGSTDTFVHALDGETGRELWKASTGWAAPGAL